MPVSSYGGGTPPPKQEQTGSLAGAILGEFNRHHPRGRRALGLVVVLVAAGTGMAVLILGSSHRTAAGIGSRPQSASGPLTSSSAAAQSAAPLTEQQAAQGLATLLAESVRDRSAVVAAVNDVNQCGPNLSQDAQTFTSAATSRQRLLTRLASLPGRSTLPGPMLQALTSAWQSSAQADQDFALWAQHEASGTCTQNDHADPNYQGATGPDNQATIAKNKFASLWDPIGAQFGLTLYQGNQL